MADSDGRYNVTVPAIAVVEGFNYICNVTGSNFNYMGVASGIYLELVQIELALILLHHVFSNDQLQFCPFQQLFGLTLSLRHSLLLNVVLQ